MRNNKPWLLAFDLSTPTGVVIVDGPGVSLCGEVDGSSRVSRLFVVAATLLSEAGISTRDISLLGVGRGPGSFTGIRVAVTAAKTLAAVLGVPLVAPDSLMVTAAGEAERGSAVFAAIDARRGEVYCAVYRLSEGYPEVSMAPLVAAPAEAAAFLAEWMDEHGCGVVGIGNGIAAYPGAWPVGMRESGTAAPRAEGLVELCRLAYGRGEVVDPFMLMPLYLRSPDARERCGGGAV